MHDILSQEHMQFARYRHQGSDARRSLLMYLHSYFHFADVETDAQRKAALSSKCHWVLMVESNSKAGYGTLFACLPSAEQLCHASHFCLVSSRG